MSIQDTIKDHIENDYYTASIKCEVVIDTILTPVIGEIMSVLTGVNMKFVTKEFPFLKNRIKEKKGEADYHTINVDYMLYSDSGKKPAVYFVELKTTESSKNEKQDQRYVYIEKHTGIKDLLKDFKKIVIRYLSLPTNYSPENECNKALKKILNDAFKYQFEKYDKKISVDDGCYTNAAKEYLKKTGKAGSSKYILQAGQIIDANLEKLINSGNCNIEFRYLLPKISKNPPKGKDFIPECSLQDILSRKEEIFEKIGDRSLKEYFNWLVEVLSSIFPNCNSGS